MVTVKSEPASYQHKQYHLAKKNHPLLKGGQSGKMDSKKGLVFLQAPSIYSPHL